MLEDIKPYYEMKKYELAMILKNKIKENIVNKDVKGVVFLDNRHNITYFDLNTHNVERFSSRDCNIIEKLSSFKYDYNNIGLVFKESMADEFDDIAKECDIAYKRRTIN